jgi:hypothetical protein
VSTLPENKLDVMLAILSTKPEGVGFNEIARELARLGCTPLYSGKRLERPLLHPKALKFILKDALEKGLVESDNPLVGARKGRVNRYYLTPMGSTYLTRHKISTLYGQTGLTWADEKWQKGYKVKFLNDFIPEQDKEKRLLLAWHPQSGDVKLAEIFNPREFEEGKYRGQLVDRNRDPDRPISDDAITEFIRNNAKNLDDDEEVKNAVKMFYDPKIHNSFIALLGPSEKISFGFPHEIGRFSSLTFVGLRYQKYFPFVPKIHFFLGMFGLTENIDILIEGFIDLVAMRNSSGLREKQIIGEKVPINELNLWEKNALQIPSPSLLCRLKGGGVCAKTNKKCTVIDIRECPTLRQDIAEFKISNSPVFG